MKKIKRAPPPHMNIQQRAGDEFDLLNRARGIGQLRERYMTIFLSSWKATARVSLYLAQYQ